MKQVNLIIGAIIALVIAVVFFTKLVVTVDANDIVIKQGVLSGHLDVWSQPGPKMQNFGSITRYNRSSQYSFSAAKDQGTKNDQSIKARFNDGGHGNISGTLQYDLPTDSMMVELHKKFGSSEAIAEKVIRPAVERSVYMSGPLMSSKESSAERRSDLLRYIEDQVVFGVYKTNTIDVKDVDPISGKERTVKRVELVPNPKAPNGFERQEESVISSYHIRAYSFNINAITYDDTVENQIKEQQALAMKIQTAIAGSREAEQRAATAEQNGKADAMKAKWDQEVLKAKEVTKAEQDKAVALTKAQQEKEVAELAKQAAEFKKQANILEGEGEAKRAELMMRANGYLPEKLEAWERVVSKGYEQMGKQQWVPTYYVGGNGSTPNGSAATNEFMQLMQLNAARNLGLDMSVKK